MPGRRRYEVIGDPQTVREDVLQSMGQNALVHLSIILADVYEEGTPIPPYIEKRELDADVRVVSKMRENWLRAAGFTSEGYTFNLAIPPKDTEIRCTLSLLDKKKKPI